MLSIILSRSDFREFDQIISLYTKEKGKLELLARGVKKITSKNAAHLEPFSFVFVDMVPGKEIDHLIKVQPVKFFKNIRSDLQKSLAAQYIVSLIDKLVESGQADLRLFELLKSWLEFVEESKKMHELMIDGFVIKLFGILGFEPILNKCIVCEKTHGQIMKENISQSKKPGLYFAGGGLICSNCLEKKREAGEEIKACGLKEISDMRVLLEKDWNRVYDFPLKTGDRKLLHDLIYEYAVFHSEKRIVDWLQIINLKFKIKTAL